MVKILKSARGGIKIRVKSTISWAKIGSEVDAQKYRRKKLEI